MLYFKSNILKIRKITQFAPSEFKDSYNINLLVLKNKDIALDGTIKNHKVDFAITDAEISSSNVETKKLLKINNIFVSKAPLKISDIKELEKMS